MSTEPVRHDRYNGTVKREEWESTVGTMRARWYQADIPDEALDAMFIDLRQLDKASVEKAIENLYLRSHSDRPPTGAEIAREWARGRLNVPSLDDAIHAIRAVFDAEREARGAISGPARAIRRLATDSPVLGELASRLGRPQLPLTPTERDRWSRAYDRWVRREELRVLSGRDDALRVAA